MRKFFCLMAVLTAVLTAQAQWDKRHYEADDLLGTPARDYFVWQDGQKLFVLNGSTNSWYVRLELGGFKIDPTHLNRRNNFVGYATVGLYDEENNLIESFKGCEMEVTDVYRMAASEASNKKSGQYGVADYLRQKKGFVRVVMPTLIGETFDLTVPCLNNGNE